MLRVAREELLDNSGSEVEFAVGLAVLHESKKQLTVSFE
jgi:hypothetical protein